MWLVPFGVLLVGGLATALLLSRGAETPPMPTAPPATPTATASEASEEPSASPSTSASPTPVDERPAAFPDGHGLALRGDDLLVATEKGLWRIDRNGEASRVPGPEHRFSLLTGGPDGRLYASGLDADGEPLGLVSSEDGRRWQEVALAGQTAFRRLVLAHDRAWAWGPDGRLLRSVDLRDWEQVGEPHPTVHDFAVHAGDPTRLIRSVPEGGAGLPEIQESRDAGVTWDRIAAPSIALLEWRTVRQLWGATEDGTVFLSEDAGYQWSPRGMLPSPPTALLAEGDTLYAAVRQVGVYRSTDDGRTWTRLDRP